MKILMIEDSAYKKDNIIKSISNIVSSEDVTVCTYRNSGLLELHKNKNYDFLILDMQFPTLCDSRIEPMNGLSVLAELRRTENLIPVIICSSSVVDYSEYDNGNVKGYIIYDSSTDMSKQFEAIMK